MKVTKSIILKEVNICKEEFKTVLNMEEGQEAQTIIKLIELRLTSEFKPQNLQGYIEWITNQIYENKLPKDSSGSFLTALMDTDSLMTAMDIEDNEELYNYLMEIS